MTIEFVYGDTRKAPEEMSVNRRALQISYLLLGQVLTTISGV